MKKLIFLLMFTLLLAPTLVQARPFINPPEVMHPNWIGEFPYQRNIYWDFNVNPVGGPPGPTPGAEYEGTHDPELWESDFVELTGDVTYHSNGKTMIGISGPGEGEAIFHLDNFPFLNPFKNIYIEATVYNSGGSLEANWGPPFVVSEFNSYGFIDYTSTDLGNNMFLMNMWFTIVPNPYWEEIILPFYVTEPGQSVFIDDLHIATECVVPEPGTLFLIGSGLLGMISIKKKKQ